MSGPVTSAGTQDVASVALADEVKALALAFGFDLVGIASPEPSDETRFFSEWLARGYAGEMDYLVRREAERVDPARLLPGIRSIVVLGLAHDPAPPPPEENAGARGLVASYAGGEDYHDVMLDRLRALEAGMAVLADRALVSKSYVDTGPVLERVFAARAGLGWIGKNTLLIDRQLGSRLMLGVVLSDLALPFDAAQSDHCGTCRACLDVCPTDAFETAYVLDARRCVAYTTIELRGEIPEPLRAAQGDQLFGCDLCQDVCPWNRRRQSDALPDPLGLRERLRPGPVWRGSPLAWVLDLDEEAWQRSSRRTALRRTGRRALIRNALIAAGNSGDARLAAAIERHAQGEDALLAEHARWALARLRDAVSPACGP